MSGRLGDRAVLGGSDAEAIERFLREVDADFPVPLSSRVDLREFARKLADVADALAAVGPGNEVRSLVAGYISNSFDGRAYVSVMATELGSRGRGFARDLLAEFIRRAHAAGMSEVHLYCDPGNEAASSVYRSAGFVPYPDPGESRPDDLHFHLRFDHSGCWLSAERPNILLSSAGRRSYLVEWFQAALGGKGGVHVTNSEPETPAMTVADASAVSPLIYSDDYIPFMLDYCERSHIGAIIPLFDVDVPVLAAHRSEFEAVGCLPVVAPETFARACSDKLASCELLGSAGLPQPGTYVGADAFLAAVARGEASFPAFVKPRWGMGSIGVARARDEAELRALCLLADRSVHSSYLRYESAAAPSDSVLVQEALSGWEYGMDVINDLSGRYRGCVVRRKLAMRSGETDVAEVIASGEDPRFDALAHMLSALSRHPGNMDVDVFDFGGELVVLEMNARFGGGYPFSHAAGVNLPRALVRWLRGGECDPSDLTVKSPGRYAKRIGVMSLEDERGGAS